jgi:hypothetical protein
MPALLSWVLLLGGIAATVAAAALAAEIEFEVALALAGLLATLLGAVGLLLSRVAGAAPRDLRPPGASNRVNLPMGPGPSATGRVPRRRRFQRTSEAAIVSKAPAAAIPTGPARGGISRTPLLVAAFVFGIVGERTLTDNGGPLDMLAGLVFAAIPIAAVLAVVSRLLLGRAWGPAVTVTVVGIAVVLGAVLAGAMASMLA